MTIESRGGELIEDVETLVDVEHVRMDGTVGIGYGVDADTGDEVVFAGDWRMMRDISEALYNGELPTAAVPSWGILSRGRGAAPSFTTGLDASWQQWRDANIPGGE